MRRLERGDRFPVDLATAQARAEDFDAVVLPGGAANSDRLRRDPAAVQFLMAMVEAGKPVAAICHGPCTLIEGDLLVGRTVTSTPAGRPICATPAPAGSTKRSRSAGPAMAS